MPKSVNKTVLAPGGSADDSDSGAAVHGLGDNKRSPMSKKDADVLPYYPQQRKPKRDTKLQAKLWATSNNCPCFLTHLQRMKVGPMPMGMPRLRARPKAMPKAKPKPKPRPRLRCKVGSRSMLLQCGIKPLVKGPRSDEPQEVSEGSRVEGLAPTKAQD